jgi:hypothetical protein
MKTIEQAIEALARKRWPEAGRFDIGSTGSHTWHGDLSVHPNGFTILVCSKDGAFLDRLVANTLNELRDKIDEVATA